jgi:hypothetical protein
MRYAKALCASVFTVAAAVGAESAPAADVTGTPSGSPQWLWDDRPACSRGERAVWVDRAGSPPRLYVDPRTGRITFEPGTPEFHGWECRPLTLSPVGA